MSTTKLATVWAGGFLVAYHADVAIPAAAKAQPATNAAPVHRDAGLGCAVARGIGSVTGRWPESAAEKSAAVANRSAGTFASALSTVASTFSGTVGRAARNPRGCSVTTFAIT